MTFMPIMWIVWSAIVVIMAGLHIYRSSLTKNEEDQIFLDDSFEQEKAEQAAIVARVAKVDPMVKIAEWAALAMTIVVIAYYVRDILIHLEIIH